MPTQDLFVILLNRLSETRLLRLAEVRYLTSFIQELEARLGPAETDDHVNNTPAENNLEEAERLFIEERGYLEERPSRRTETRASRPERPIAVRASRPERPIVANTHPRNNILRRRRRARQAAHQARRQAGDRSTRPYRPDSILTRRPDASHVEQASNIVITQVAAQLGEDIERRAVTYARTDTHNPGTNPDTSHQALRD
mmetsp:Transcript_6936/g.10100  ORF Transcript_6936/g.10100 Transcript_6936/m.10100 type:complete len:200 (+) Transcript_6936:98-697(+)